MRPIFAIFNEKITQNIGPFKLIKMLEMLEKAKIARGVIWPILAIFNLKVTPTFSPFKLRKLLGNVRNARKC